MLCESDKGPIFFIVARGKFSEGKNFPGKLARAVFMVGVPFLNTMDPKVLMKKIWYKEY